MTVALIGSGNVAAVLGRELLAHGHHVQQVWSRNPGHAKQLADELGATVATDLRTLTPGLDLYLIAVTDDALPLVAAKVLLKDELVVHTAGSVSREVLRNCSSQYGVLWPMKMIRKNMQRLGEVTMVVDGSDAGVTGRLTAIAGQLSQNVTVAGDELRIRLHMLASVTANFTNHLYHLAASYCEAEGIDFSLLYPIITDTANRIRSSHPAEVQAGPAFRKDLLTLEKHRALLQDYPQLAQLYEAISASIMKKQG